MRNPFLPFSPSDYSLSYVPHGGGKGGGGGQSGTQQVNSTTTTSNIPEYARPYFESLMNRAQTVSNDPYQTYGGQRIAPFSGQQLSAFQSAGENVGRYQPFFNQAQSAFQSAGQPTVQNTYSAQTMTPGNWIDPNVAQSYMSPYMQGVVDIGKREATRDYNIQQQARNAKAAQAGAFGGYRQAIVDSEANRNLNEQLQDMQTRGLQSAYETGLGAFNQDRSAQIGANQLNNQFLQEQSRLGMGAEQANKQFGLGAGQALAGLGQATQQAGITDIQTLLNSGAMQQGQTQAGLDMAYQDFLSQRDYPRQNLNWLSGILRGVPVSANSSVVGYQPAPSTLSQISGLGLGAAGLAKMFG